MSGLEIKDDIYIFFILLTFSPNNTNPKLHLPHNQIYVTSDGVEVRWDHVNNMWMVNSPTSGSGGGDGTALLQNTTALHQYIMQKQQLQVYPHQATQQQPPYNFDTQQQSHPQQAHLMSELPDGGGGVGVGTDDELMFLFDVIHRKSVRLRKDIEVLQQVIASCSYICYISSYLLLLFKKIDCSKFYNIFFVS